MSDAVPVEPSDAVPVEPILLTCSQVAATLAVSESKARRLIKAGEIPSILIDGCRRVRRTDVRSFVASRPASTPGGAS